MPKGPTGQQRPKRGTPAMQIGLADRVWEWEDILKVIDARNPVSKKRGPDKKQHSN